jgi:hypothetical protein
MIMSDLWTGEYRNAQLDNMPDVTFEEGRHMSAKNIDKSIPGASSPYNLLFR